MTDELDNLNEKQRALLEKWLPGARLERCHSWGLVETIVLEMKHAGSTYIVKASGESDHHIARELYAHRNWLEPWTSIGRAPQLKFGDSIARLLVTHYLPGDLVLEVDATVDPSMYRQAGELLAVFHEQGAVADHEYEHRENKKSHAWLDGSHRISGSDVDLLRLRIASWPTPASILVPTHGDWHPRNWLVHEGAVSIIDLGRAAMRPAMTDFARLSAHEFLRDREFEEAFLEGYGSDPRETDGWYRNQVREAISTAAWAYRVGDEQFEAQGLRMISDVLSQ